MFRGLILGRAWRNVAALAVVSCLGVGTCSVAVSLAADDRAPTPELAAPTPEMKRQAKAERDAYIREQRRLAPGRKERGAKSRRRFKRMQRREARELLSSAFPEYIREPLWSPPKLGDGERIVGYRGDSVALVEHADGKRGLLDSKVPLRVDAGDGTKEATNLDLEQVGDTFRPKSPVVETVIAADAGTIDLPEAHLGLDLPGENVAGELTEGNKVFYANTATDTDWVVSPLPRGAAVAAHLRSADSPHALPLTVDVPGGAQLRADERGGAEIVTAQGVVATVTPPVAIDAAKQPVKAAYRISGDQLVIEVEQSDTTEYPILVDPVLDYTPWQANPAYGRSGWKYGAPFPGFAGGEYSPWGYGLVHALGWSRWYEHAWWAWWLYTAPGASHIFRADYQLTHTPVNPATPVCYSLGLYHSAYGWQNDSFSFGTGAWAPYINARGPFSSCGGVVNFTEAQCLNATCSPQPGIYGNHAAFQQWTYGASVRSDVNWTYLAGASIHLADSENPGLSATPASGVLSPSSTALTFVAHDPGLGIKRIKISSPTTSGWNQYNDIQFNCFGTSWSPCPTGYQTGTILAGNLGPGHQQIRVEVWDAGGGYASTTPAVLMPHPFPASSGYGGMNDSIDTPDEMALFERDIESLSPDSGDDVWFNQVSPTDRARIAAAGVATDPGQLCREVYHDDLHGYYDDCRPPLESTIYSEPGTWSTSSPIGLRRYANAAEKSFCKTARGLFYCPRFFWATRRATETAGRFFTGGGTADNVRTNAFKHAYWVGIMAISSEDAAWDFAQAHENAEYFSANSADRKSSQMDVINNHWTIHVVHDHKSSWGQPQKNLCEHLVHMFNDIGTSGGYPEFIDRHGEPWELYYARYGVWPDHTAAHTSIHHPVYRWYRTKDGSEVKIKSTNVC